MEQYCDINMKVHHFSKVLIDALDSNASLITKRVKYQCQPPWFNSTILKGIHKRELAKRKKDYNDYKLWRNMVVEQIRRAKQNYYQSLFNECQGNSSKIWKLFNDITGRKENNIISSICVNGQEIQSQLDIVNKFNQYFVNVAESVKSALPNVDYLVTDQFLRFIYDKGIKANSFTIPLMSRDDVTRFLHTLDTHKGKGHDGLSASFLKAVSSSITDALLDIVNTSILSGIFPSRWKESSVKPLHKGGAKNMVNNYRPISILCVASKLLERHVYKNLYNYITDNDILCINQSGFRKKHSCHSCLTNILEYWYCSINNGNVVGSVELDFSKAFDVLDHQILLSKLKYYGCDHLCIKWFKSYLENRFQHVKLGNNTSSSLPVMCGVPQGSILGPLLFILFTNDMHLYVKNSRLDSYADDSNISSSADSLEQLVDLLQHDLDSISHWCDANKLVLNAKKSSVMFICSPQKMLTLNTEKLCLTLNNQVLNVQKEQKVLGVTIDSTLSWRSHIINMCKKLSQLLGLLWRVRFLLNKNAKIMFYNSLILSRLSYCLTLWGNCPKDGLLKLFRLQKRAARLVLNCNLDVSTVELFNRLGWLSIYELIIYHKCIFMYNVHKNNCPSYLTNHFRHVSQVQRYNLRNYDVNNFIIPKPKLELFKSSIQYSGTVLWNNLPQRIKILTLCLYLKNFSVNIF